MAILMATTFYLMESKSERFFLIGLVFSTGGDFFLDYDRVNWFVFGLGSFLLAHLFYIMALRPVERKNTLAIIAYSTYGLIIIYIISPGLAELFVPVLAYMSVLMIMGIFTLISTKSNSWLVIGGISFIISDSIIGINRFYTPIPHSHLLIMPTYYFAQFALVKGIFLNKNRY
ncbi:MAG: lysoplasmalogenase [Gammaproteobacteria bacterium]|nr:lysoplasmalogenase [Gammaproteobacteria bacterium]